MSENLKTFPVIPLRGLTIIPGTTVHFDVRRKASIAAAEESMIDDKELFVVAQKDPVEDTPGFDGIYKVGTVVVVKQLNKLPDDVVRVMVEAKAKGEIQSLYMADGHFAGEVSIIEEDKNTLTEAQEEAYVRELRDTLKLFEGKVRELSPSSLRGLLDISNIETLMNQILMRIKVGYKLKQEYLEQNSIEDKFTTIYSFLAKENEVAQVRNEIIEKVKQRLEKSQKEHILREQMQIIKEELIISNRLGSVPDDVPKVPLLVDVEKIQKRLRVPFTAEIKELILALRKPNDLERSIFFHRLQLLGIDWTILGRIDGKGTFKEKWTLYHKPEQIIQIIERAIWGNTVMEATQKYLLKQMAEIQHIPELTALLSTVLPADLPALVEAMTVQLDRLSAASTDILEMMEAVPDLVNIVRYGNVRDLDFSKVGDMLEAMIARILAGGVLVCINIDEEAAGDLLNKLVATDYALSILNREELNLMWRNFIGQVRSSANVHPLLSGYATRLLNDKGEISAEEMETTLSFYSSVGNAPADMAYWFEGFLRSSGSILLLDDRLWNLVNNWVCSQDKDTFMELLPVLRRTFSEFTSAERRKLGEKARRTDSTGTSSAVGASVTENECLNREEAKKVIPVIRQLLGLETK